jgi:hypothetical protein
VPSAYRFVIIHAESGEIVYANTPLEAQVEVIENLKTRVRAKGVGLGRTTNHVVEDVGQAMLELLRDLKKVVPPPSR